MSQDLGFALFALAVVIGGIWAAWLALRQHKKMQNGEYDV